MALTNIIFTPQAQINKVIVARPNVLKVASTSSGALGSVEATGLAPGAVVSWSLIGNPGGTISLAARQGDQTKADLSFDHVAIRMEPYLLIIQASTLADGKVVRIPLAIMVRGFDVHRFLPVVYSAKKTLAV